MAVYGAESLPTWLASYKSSRIMEQEVKWDSTMVEQRCSDESTGPLLVQELTFSDRLQKRCQNE